MSIRTVQDDVAADLTSLVLVSLTFDVLKELMANGVDSGATQIRCYVDWDSKSIQVLDNGEGIHSVDFEHIAKDGFTSKHCSTEKTLGYRGRSLYSMAQLGFLSVISNGLIKKNDGELVRKVDPERDFIHARLPYLSSYTSTSADLNHLNDLYRFRNIDLNEANDSFASLSMKTCVTCTGLFTRFPIRQKLELKQSRLKFLRKVQEHSFKMVGARKTALSVSLDQKRVISILPSDLDLASRYCKAFHVKPQFYSNSSTVLDCTVMCAVSVTEIASKHHFVFVNEVSVETPVGMFKSPTLLCRAILILIVTDSQRILESVSVEELVKLAVPQIELLVEAIRPKLTLAEKNTQGRLPKRNSRSLVETLPTKRGRGIDRILNINSSLLPSDVLLAKSELADCRIVNQIDDKFILLATRKSPVQLFVVDQHACDERIKFEEIVDEFIQNACSGTLSVPLVPPLVFPISPGDLGKLELNIDQFKVWGISCEISHSHLQPQLQPQLLVHSIPEILEGNSKLFRGLVSYSENLINNVKPPANFIKYNEISEFYKVRNDYNVNNDKDNNNYNENDRDNDNDRDIGGVKVVGGVALPRWACILPSIPGFIIDALNTKACRSSIMFGTRLDAREMEYLIYALSKCQLPFQCAHGRPSVVPLSVYMQDRFDK